MTAWPGRAWAALGRLVVRVHWAYAALFLFLLSFGLAGAGMLWTAHEVRASQARWCDALTVLTTASQGTPPETDSGRRLFADFGLLHREFGCEQK